MQHDDRWHEDSAWCDDTRRRDDRGHDHGHDDSRWHDDSVSGAPGSGLFWPTFRYALVAVMLVAVIAWVMGFRAEPLYVVAGAEAPAASQTRIPAGARPAGDGGREIVVRAGRGGHFTLTAFVNGEEVRFMVDTGATTVALTPLDARRLGFDAQLLDYEERYQTANGITMGAPVTLREVRIGQLSLYDVRATVLSRPMSVSLLGMSFLKRLSGHEVRDGKMILRW